MMFEILDAGTVEQALGCSFAGWTVQRRLTMLKKDQRYHPEPGVATLRRAPMILFRSISHRGDLLAFRPSRGYGYDVTFTVREQMD